jgi:hypothetical protein
MGNLIANRQQLLAVDIDAKAEIDGMDIDHHQQRASAADKRSLTPISAIAK